MFILQMMKLIDYHETDYIVVFLQLCIFIGTNDVTSSIGIGYWYQQKSKYWVLGAKLGIVLTIAIGHLTKTALTVPQFNSIFNEA